ncbi:MAG: acetyltransferase (GNAT) family protein [Candidatus Methanoperedens nitroreducens]|uniref:Acetyltransferase (GNAT) family protein n=1 Tax=Candidatus Methanoperedens nitratireducens TaxID=1392998 RepID=A0A0P8A4G3_9EURY|nr:putative beta-lysine N-acetyltransferase [Candidatus Methanoperedens sp. BLZ2]KAB2948138.1 MAG: putative beta-lysine N-acetyltransferase [Candidatus Methanoperedens sp.]KPQ43059.1 MAG: acetyltransferase (GNAT) family protein [Candidatus Methanoperedens sp. BLZ1]MBZ0176341.1 putative beta-lysine N-acetyltransferase [Candidatus Methanoperedens nitroreducens]CAG0958915.1 N-acetyltransferase YodP [Methanosarcinales archaeon]MCX9080182.1 putative beta-lysine N-acetyltransferase [Candidatus Metha
MMNDTITNIGSSILQQGKHNDRIYLMKLSNDDLPVITDRLDRLALAEKYSKIIAKVPGFAKDKFTENGYIVEASIPGFYNCSEDVYFMGKYFTESRMCSYNYGKIKEILKTAVLKSSEERTAKIVPGFHYRICGKSDVDRIAGVYKKSFETYPFPIKDPMYIAKTMDENFIYFSIRRNNKIVALSSTEIDAGFKNVEMTDFATLPEYRGNGLAAYLLHNMESEMRRRNMEVAYTIARAVSHGINNIFAKMGYIYGGTLLNNTNIAGSFESMNVWYKYL